PSPSFFCVILSAAKDLDGRSHARRQARKSLPPPRRCHPHVAGAPSPSPDPILIPTSTCPRRGRRDSYRDGRGSTPAHRDVHSCTQAVAVLRCTAPLPNPLLGQGEGIKDVENAPGSCFSWQA